MEDFCGTRSYSCTRMIPCCSHIPHFHHTPSQFYIRWYLQAKLDIWTRYANETTLPSFERGKSHQKLWCCVAGVYNKQPFVNANKGIAGCLWFINRKIELYHWWEPTNVTNKLNKLAEYWKAFIDTVGALIWKMNFYFTISGHRNLVNMPRSYIVGQRTVRAGLFEVKFWCKQSLLSFLHLLLLNW